MRATHIVSILFALGIYACLFTFSEPLGWLAICVSGLVACSWMGRYLELRREIREQTADLQKHYEQQKFWQQKLEKEEQARRLNDEDRWKPKSG